MKVVNTNLMRNYFLTSCNIGRLKSREGKNRVELSVPSSRAVQCCKMVVGLTLVLIRCLICYLAA